MKRIVAAALAILCLVVSGLAVAITTATAETYPSRTVTIIVPYPAGGPTDTTARQIANSLNKILNGNFIVENVTGGSTIIATNRLAHATPDGYTLLMHNLQISANASLFKTLPFDTEKSILPVALVNQNPLVLVGRPGLPANNMKELLALMKKERLKEALPGIGTTGHLMSALFLQEAKVKADFIPYRGAAPAMNDLLGDHVDLFVGTPQSVAGHVASGKLKAYGVTAKQKLPKMPTAESLVDVLGPKFDIIYWQGLFAPTGTPKDVVDKLNAAVAKAVAEPELSAIWDKQGFAPFPQDQRSVAAAQAFMKSEMARWGKVIRDNNITISQ
jgi:tripartite-type tricarboxylate transporter receptor subunit TctC